MRYWATGIMMGSFGAVTLFARAADAQQVIEWNHAECTTKMAATDAKCTPVRSVSAQDGEKIAVNIKNTCPDEFTYTIVPIDIPKETSLHAAKTCNESKVLDITHEAKYGGYIIYVLDKDGQNLNAGNARLTIAVKTAAWQLSFGGGFTANGLVHPAFALRGKPASSGSSGTSTESTKYTVVEERGRRDHVGQSVVSFVHLRRSTFELWGLQPALSFGLGVEPSRAGDFYPGASVMFGDRAALSAGVVIGQVPTLPAGRQLGDEVTDANALGTLGSQKRTSWFVGLSYHFLGGGANDLKKPFQGQSPPSTAVEPAGTDGKSAGQRGSGVSDSTSVPAVSVVGDAEQTVKPGAVSQPLRIRALPGLAVGWSWAPELAGVIATSASIVVGADSVASATIKVPSTFTGELKVRANVCDTNAKCSEKFFTLRPQP